MASKRKTDSTGDSSSKKSTPSNNAIPIDDDNAGRAALGLPIIPPGKLVNLNSQLASSVVGTGEITYEGDDTVVYVEELGEIFTVTIVNTDVGLKADTVVDFYAPVVGLIEERVYTNASTREAFASFNSQNAYEEAYSMNPIFGDTYRSANYDPRGEKGRFYRVLVSCRIMDSLLEASIKEVFAEMGINITSARIRAGKNYATAYLENEKHWMEMCRVKSVVVRAGRELTFLRVVPTYAATSSTEWTKLFISNLPGTHLDSLRRFMKGRWGVDPEIFALLRKPDTGRIGNMGFILTKSGDMADYLISLTPKQRTVKNKLIRVVPATSQ